MSVAHDHTVGIEALTALGHGVCVFDSHGRIVSWNSRLEKLGLAASEVAGRELLQVLTPLVPDPARKEALEAGIRDALAGRGPIVLREVAMEFPPHRQHVFRLCLTSPGESGSHAALIFEDVTESLRSREQFERILESTPDGIFVIDADRRMRLFNRACGQITGRSPEEVLHDGCTCNEIVQCHTEDGVSLANHLCPAKTVFRGEISHQREEMLLTNAAGEERWVETTYSPAFNDRGEVEYVIGMLRDVHDRKVLEDRLNQTEKLASFGQLVAGIAHEIKNPLAIILSSLDVLQNETRPTEQRAEAGSFIREEIKRLDDRLRSFLAFARPRELRPRPTVLGGLLTRRAATMETLFPEIEFSVETSQPEPIVMADEEQLTQVLTNLIMNAADALEGKGRIMLRARHQADMAIMEVEDTGPGIPLEHQPRIFDPFFTTKADGTGLGLSICYQIILAHKGTISISSGKNGPGACFTVRLPMAARARE